MGIGRGGGSSNNNNNNGGVEISSSTKKVIQTIKEIVNFPDDEIYAVLKDCNMDPSEAVNRLLNQDTFHQVKSKREKKKEPKDGIDSRSHGSTSTSFRGDRGRMDRYATRKNTSQYGSSEYGAPRGKPVYKKEVAPPAYTNSSMSVPGNNVNKWQTPVGNTSTDKPLSVNVADSILPTPQPSAYPSAWSGMSGQMSMADIVKMGRQPRKTSTNLNTPQQNINSQQNHEWGQSESAPTNDEWSRDESVPLNDEWGREESVPPNDEWGRDLPAARGIPVDPEPYSEPYDGTQQQFEGNNDDDTLDDEQAAFVESVPGSNQNIQENISVSASGYDDDQYQNIGSYQAHHQEVEDPNVSVSSMTNNFENLSFPKDEEDSHSEDDGPAVKIPDHLQVQTADLSHLSFGSFGSGMSAPFSGSLGSRPNHTNDEEVTAPTDAPVVHSEARNSEYFEDDHLRNAAEGNNAHQMGAGSDNFEPPSVSQADILQQEASEAAQVNQYSYPAANYTLENSQQLNSSFAQSPANAQMMQGLPSLAGVMPYSNSVPNPLLALNMQQQLREAYSQFPISQAAKYGNSVSSLNDPAASMAEALKTNNLAAQAQPSQTQQGGNNISGAAGLQQHLAMHPYSQHSVPMGLVNMMGYPLLPQGYSYMPSAFQQQPFAAGNTSYPQSLAALLPQYKNSVSVSSLPQSGTVPSGYGGFGNSNNVNVPNNFPLNPPTGAPPGTSLNYEELLASQYKDASHLLSLQQGGPESRTMSGVPGNNYYSFQGQNQQQQPGGFRQSQQQQTSQHYGVQSGYNPNYYHSQGGHSLDHHQQMSRDGSSQGQPPKQTQQQLWQNTY